MRKKRSPGGLLQHVWEDAVNSWGDIAVGLLCSRSFPHSILILFITKMPWKVWCLKGMATHEGNLEKGGPGVLSTKILPSGSFTKLVLGIFYVRPLGVLGPQQSPTETGNGQCHERGDSSIGIGGGKCCGGVQGPGAKSHPGDKFHPGAKSHPGTKSHPGEHTGPGL